MEEGTIVHVEYDLYNADSGDLIETTREDVAKEHDMHQEGRSYTPLVCVVGAGNLISGFEDSLLEAKADKDISLEIAPADAYGEKDPDQIETISIDKLLRHVRDPKSLYIGGPVSIEGRQGILSYLAAGRARIDYRSNHCQDIHDCVDLRITSIATSTCIFDYRVPNVYFNKTIPECFWSEH